MGMHGKVHELIARMRQRWRNIRNRKASHTYHPSHRCAHPTAAVLTTVLILLSLTVPLVASAAQGRAAARASGSVQLTVGDRIWIGPAGGRYMHLFYADGVPAYCAEHMKEYPAAGSYTVRDVNAPTGRNALIKAILYYSPDAPGGGKVTLPLWSAYANNGQTAAEMRAIDVHVMLCYAYGGNLETTLPSFDFSNWMSVRSWMFKNVLGVNESGRVVNENAPYQKLLDMVDEVPDWFEVFEFAGSGATQVILSYRNTVEVRFNKVSANASITSGNDEYSYAGATYDIYDAKTNEKVSSIKTDANGKASLRLEPGKYYAIETKAPAGFVKNPDRIDFTVSGGNSELTLTDTPGTVRVRIVKVDSATGGTAQHGASLEGAEFQLTDANGTVHTATTDSSGVASFSDLPLGTSTIVETKAPTGYKLDETPHRFTVTADDMPASGVIELEPEGEFVDDIIAFNLNIVKYLDTGAESSGLQEPGREIRFDIISNTTNKVVGTIETGENGSASTEGRWFGSGERPDSVTGALPYDEAGYTVREDPESVPDGYQAAPEWQITCDQMLDGATLHYIVDNDAVRSRIQVVKVDAKTGQTVPLAGFTFQLLDEHKEVITQEVWYPNHESQSEFTTDESGMVTFPESLQPGTYYIREIQAAAPYLACDDDIKVVVSSAADIDPVTVVKIEDARATGTATITKTADETGTELAGAEFDVIAIEDVISPDGSVDAVSGEIVDHVMTDEDGSASCVNLSLGSGSAEYAFVETKAPDGYALDGTPRPFTLTYDDDHTDVVFASVEATNQPTEIIISKTILESDTPLKGAVFEYWREEDGTGKPDEPNRITPNEDGIATLSPLAPGTYCIQEVEAPAGYLVNDTIHVVTVDEHGLIAGEAIYSLALENDYTKVDFSKRDITNEEEIPGAQLSILDADGNVVESWTSGETDHRIDALPPGEYTLVEEMTPNTYDMATSVPFTVEATGEIQSVVMYDEPIEVSGNIDKRQEIADPTHAGVEADGLVSAGGTNRAEVSISEDGSYDYSIDFRNTSSTWVDEFTVTDEIHAAAEGLAVLTGITTPVISGDYDGLCNVWYQTNKTEVDYSDPSDANATRSDGHENPWLDHESTANVLGDDGRALSYRGWCLWAEDVDATEAMKLNVTDLELDDGEVVVAVRFEFGRVEKDCTSRVGSWDRDDLKDTHDDLADIADGYPDDEKLHGAIMHMRVTDAYTEGSALFNSATLDLFRNGGSLGTDNPLEDHDGDAVEQTPRSTVTPLAQTGNLSPVPVLLTTSAAAITLALVARRYVHRRK